MPRSLAALALPMILGIVFILAVNLVDTYFVGQLGTAELAAMSFTFPVVSLVASVGFGLGIGTTSAVSRAIGGGDERRVRRLTTHALVLAVAVIVVISGLGILTQDAVFLALGAEPELLPMLGRYMTIWYLGAICLVVPMVANGAMRAGGDAKTPAKLMAIAAIVNAVLDPPLIFGWGPFPALGITGAALATVGSRLVTLAAAFAVLRKMQMLDLHWPSRSELMDSWRAILSVGMPASISNALTPVATAVLTALVALQGTAAVAGYGVASRLEGLLLIAPMALSAALTPFIGQNWGGHQPERVGTALSLSTRFVFGWGLGIWLLLIVGSDAVAGLFTQDAAVREAVSLYAWIVPVSYGFHGLVSIVSSAFNAVDRAVRATLLSAARSLAFAVPFAWLGSEFSGLTGIFGGLAAATVCTGLIAFVWSTSLRKVRDDEIASTSTLEGLDEDLTPVVRRLLERALSIEGLKMHPRPINTIGFYVGEHEIGHLHRTGHIDLHMPPAVHDALLDAGKAEHHRHLSGASWVTHRLDVDRDVEEAAWLLELGRLIHRLATDEHADWRERVEALGVPAGVAGALEETSRRCRTRPAPSR